MSIIDRILEGIVLAQRLQAEANAQAAAEMRAREFTNCTACQAALAPFLKDTPYADEETINAVVRTLWETCSDCIADYCEYLDKTECQHGKHGLNNCSECLDEWADANAPEDNMLDHPSEWERKNFNV